MCERVKEKSWLDLSLAPCILLQRLGLKSVMIQSFKLFATPLPVVL